MDFGYYVVCIVIINEIIVGIIVYFRIEWYFLWIICKYSWGIIVLIKFVIFYWMNKRNIDIYIFVMKKKFLIVLIYFFSLLLF